MKVEDAIDEMLKGFETLDLNDSPEVKAEDLLSKTASKIADICEYTLEHKDSLVHLDSCLKAQLQKKSYDQITSFHNIAKQLEGKIPTVTSPREYALTFRDLFNDFGRVVNGIKDRRERKVVDSIELYKEIVKELKIFENPCKCLFKDHHDFSKVEFRSDSKVSEEESSLKERLHLTIKAIMTLSPSNLIKEDQLEAAVYEGNIDSGLFDRIALFMQEQLKHNSIKSPRSPRKMVIIAEKV